MRTGSFLFFSLAFLHLASLAQAQYQLVWEDEFNGTQVDPANWEFEIGTGCPSLCGWGNNELQFYREENATVSGGFLTITAKEESYGGRQYTSSRMRTRNLQDWKYGKFEMRAKLPEGQGLWPAFWMLPTDNVYGGWPESGEIDIVELVGHENDKVYGTIHYGDPWPDNDSSGASYTLSSGNFHDSFHTFTLEWEPGELRWYVDGELYSCIGSWFTAGGPFPAPFDQEFHLMLNVAVGGNWPGDPDGSTQFPQELVVDWIRVYQQPQGALAPRIVFDGMDHNNPFGNGWFFFNGSGGGGIGGNTTDLPPEDACIASLEAGWNGGSGFIGGFGRTNPTDLTDMTHFEFWINPDANQTYTLEINLQDDDNGDNSIPQNPVGNDDEFQYNLVVGPSGPGAISGGGWQKISIPLADFYDDNSYLWGGNGVLDPYPTGSGGNGQLINVVWAISDNDGGSRSFRTDYWTFADNSMTSVPGDFTRSGQRLLSPGTPNPFGATTSFRFELPQPGSISLEVYDLRGRLVRELESGRVPAGPYSAAWDGRTTAGRPAASGVYFVRLSHGETIDTRKVVLQR